MDGLRALFSDHPIIATGLVWMVLALGAAMILGPIMDDMDDGDELTYDERDDDAL